jgi:hypothetical protein
MDAKPNGTMSCDNPEHGMAERPVTPQPGRLRPTSVRCARFLGTRLEFRDTLAAMPLFRRPETDPDAAPGMSGAPAESAQMGTSLEYFSGLSVPQRAAEILEKVTAPIDQDALAMDQLLAPWLPESDWMALSVEQRKGWLSLAVILREAFQALVLTRMVIRQEQTYKGATWVTYVNSPDGRAALERGDVADVVARRLPD